MKTGARQGYGCYQREEMEKQRKVIEEAIKTGNTESLHIRPMSWGPITIMAKDDTAHRVFMFTHEEIIGLQECDRAIGYQQLENAKKAETKTLANSKKRRLYETRTRATRLP